MRVARPIRFPACKDTARFARAGLRAIGVGVGLGVMTLSASAQRIDNSVAVFAALDKVTAKISRLEVPLNQTATFRIAQADATGLLYAASDGAAEDHDLRRDR